MDVIKLLSFLHTWARFRILFPFLLAYKSTAELFEFNSRLVIRYFVRIQIREGN